MDPRWKENETRGKRNDMTRIRLLQFGRLLIEIERLDDDSTSAELDFGMLLI